MSELFPVKCSCGHSERQHILGICIMCNCEDGPGWKKPVPAPAEPAEYTCPRCESNVSTHICMGEPVAGETKPDKVQSALRGIRDIVKGRCNHLDLEVIREIINEAIGHEQV